MRPLSPLLLLQNVSKLISGQASHLLVIIINSRAITTPNGGRVEGNSPADKSAITNNANKKTLTLV